MRIWMISVHTNFHDVQNHFQLLLELSSDLFGCPLDKQSCTPNFGTFRAMILTPFKPNPSETAQQSFTFE